MSDNYLDGKYAQILSFFVIFAVTWSQNEPSELPVKVSSTRVKVKWLSWFYPNVAQFNFLYCS